MDEFGYKFYDLVNKKVIRSRDVVFVEDQTIENIVNAEKPVAQPSNDLPDLDITPFMPTAENGEAETEGDQHDIGAGENRIVDPLHDEVDDDADDEHLALEIPTNAPRRSTRDRKSSLRYSSHEFILLTDGG